jgi:hypothetical protein
MELGFGSSLLVRFQARRCSEIDNVVTAALLPHRPESSDVGVIGMITASARHRWTYRRRNGTKRKFFNDFSRACARVRARRGAFGVRQSGRTQFDRIPYNLNQFGVLASSPITCTRISMASLKNCLEKKVGLHHLE